MKIPIYSNLKTTLENKGLDSITSGRIAWFVSAMALSAVFSFGYVMYILFGRLYYYNSSFDSDVFFIVFIIAFFPALFVLLSLHLRFIIFHLFYIIIFVLCSLSKQNEAPEIFVLLTTILCFSWFFHKKMPLIFRFLFFFMYLLIILEGFIIFVFANYR